MTEVWTNTQGVTGTKNTMANVNEVDAATVAATTWTEMTSDDVVEGVAVTATCTATKIVIGTAAMATVTRTVGMKIDRKSVV